MKLQLLSDLHLESETFDPDPAPGAELLVLAGDIDSGWTGYERFAGWPVPVIVVAGNHEFDRRELDDAYPALHDLCARLGFTLLQRQSSVVADAAGRRVRFCGTVRWSDFDLYGAAQRPRAERAASHFLRRMEATRRGVALDAAGVRAEGLACRDWLEGVLAEPAAGRWDATVVVTHFGPSTRSSDPRYGRQPGTASFCNADDDLVRRADLWLHGHVHCRHDYRVGSARVVCNARGIAAKNEIAGYDPLRLVEV